MPYGNAIPLTGGAGALAMGHLFGLDDIIATAIVAVLFAIAAFRYGSRIGRARGRIFALAGAAVLGVAFLAHLGGLGWPMATTAGLATAVAVLYLSSRLVNQERRVNQERHVDQVRRVDQERRVNQERRAVAR